MNAPLGTPLPSIPTRLGRVYDIALVQARATARTHGYALAVHGSQLRDLDLIAVPWVEECSPPVVLAEAIRSVVRGVFTTKATPPDAPTERPHGRLGWAIMLMGEDARALTSVTAVGERAFHPYLDLSVVPRAESRPPSVDALVKAAHEFFEATAALTPKVLRERDSAAWDRFDTASVQLRRVLALHEQENAP